MNRRWWLRGALGAAILGAAATGFGVSQWQAGFKGGQWPTDLTPVLQAIGAAVLAGNLPTQGAEQQKVLGSWLQRLATTLNGLPPPVQAEVSDLFALLRLASGRLILCGESAEWGGLSASEVGRKLQQMRTSVLPPRQQAFMALRDLTLAAYYAGSETWPALGYPGPTQP